MSTVFKNYARYYNLLYKDKDYAGEVDHIDKLIKTFSRRSAKTVLDIGCGTGTHASWMARLEYTMTGVDLSPEMVSHAKERNIENADFHVGNATDFKLDKKFDVVTSLFHVLSYQTSNASAQAMIRNAASHLTENGLFVFDFWYGPAVLSEKPSVKIRRLEDEEIKVTRIAEPGLRVNDNVVDVNFELLIQDKATLLSETVKEVHPMRYFFKPEIELLLENAGFELIYFNEWMTGAAPSEKTWGVCAVAVKK
jgi:SAM-dependent methyltransferase